MTKIVPVILSGGSGTRLWPLSLADKPKQFLPLVTERTMFAETLARTGNADRFGPALVVGAERHCDLMLSELSCAGFEQARIVLEPSARNTAPAIALAALAAGSGSAIMLVMPSDHVISDLEEFLAAVDIALPVAQNGWLVTFGIEPTSPETGFGYIKMAQPLEKASAVRKVARFIEKPPQEQAEAMLAEGDHAWNAGIFLMRADRYIEELGIHAPEILHAVQASMEGVDLSSRLIRPLPQQFAACPANSIDYAVIERAARVAVVPVSFGWSDVGSWDALAHIARPNAAGNTSIGQVIALDCTNSYINSNGITVTASGIDNLIVIANGTHVLIMPKGRSQDVKMIVEAMKQGV